MTHRKPKIYFVRYPVSGIATWRVTSLGSWSRATPEERANWARAHTMIVAMNKALRNDQH